MKKEHHQNNCQCGCNNEITESESKNHPQRSLLLQAIDGITESIPVITSTEILKNDKIVLFLQYIVLILLLVW